MSAALRDRVPHARRRPRAPPSGRRGGEWRRTRARRRHGTSAGARIRRRRGCCPLRPRASALRACIRVRWRSRRVAVLPNWPAVSATRMQYISVWMSRLSSIVMFGSAFDAALRIPCLRYFARAAPPDIVRAAMIKVLAAGLIGTIGGVVAMIIVIVLAGTTTSGASSVGLGALPLSTASLSSGPVSTPTSTPTSTPPPDTGGGSTGGSTGKAAGNADNGKALFTGAAGCGSCHTLAAAGTTGAVGPDLDSLAGDAREGRRAARRVHQVVDRRSRRVCPLGVQRRRHADDLRDVAVRVGHRRPRGVHLRLPEVVSAA